jgi:transaldolase/glucose-6-phosphate isomerase
VTLLFSVAVYEQVAWAYIAGLEKRAAQGKDISQIASVASFFVSRIDNVIDPQLAAKIKESRDPARIAELEGLVGGVAIANAKVAYIQFQDIFKSTRFQTLQGLGARVQRLLWASTGTKNPNYPDTYYVEALIGPDTVNTIPVATFNAFRDHGKVAHCLTTDLEKAKAVMAQLPTFGIDMTDLTNRLLEAGVRLFAEAFDQLMAVIRQKQETLREINVHPPTYALGTMNSVICERLKTLEQEKFCQRFWGKEATLWHDDPTHQEIIRNAMGWLHLTTRDAQQMNHLQRLTAGISGQFTDLILMGMGGSSLCAEVFGATFGVMKGFPRLHILDSTIPSQIQNLEKRVDIKKTLFIVSSKSGSTIEPMALYQYFFDRVRQIKGDVAGEQFIAITDPGSPLETLARKNKFHEILYGIADVGGRYSALSIFGMAPAALMGVDVKTVLKRGEAMRRRCHFVVPPKENIGIVLGVTIGEMAQAGSDKVTFVLSPDIRNLGAWLEQLLAESTGKDGKGVIPVHEEPLGTPDFYGNDRLFVYIRLLSHLDRKQEEQVAALEKSGHPVIRIELSDLADLGGQFFLWEIATATACAILRVNPFDQPNVRESKESTSQVLREWERHGNLHEEVPVFSDEGIDVYADEANKKRLLGASTLEEAMAAFLSHSTTSDYVAFNAYLERTEQTHNRLQAIRQQIRDQKRLATLIGYGPRFLHSIGQIYRGGANKGLFIQITADDAGDLPILGESYSFGMLKSAQALGDFLSLNVRNRRVMRIHLGANIMAGLIRIQAALK